MEKKGVVKIKIATQKIRNTAKNQSDKSSNLARLYNVTKTYQLGNDNSHLIQAFLLD